MQEIDFILPKFNKQMQHQFTGGNPINQNKERK